MNHELAPNHSADEPSPADILSQMPSFEERQKQSPEDIEKRNNFDKLVSFLDDDLYIKQTLADLAPPNSYMYNEQTATSYSDSLYNGFNEISDRLHDIMDNYYKSDAIEQRLQQIRQDIIASNIDPNRLVNTYQQDFSGMSLKFVKEVQEETSAYSFWSNPHRLDRQANSINEILHLMHASIVNDDAILHDLPVLSKNEESNAYLYGTDDIDNQLAQKIYNHFDQRGESESTTDIVALEKRILMMVRDSGHALTIDIQEDPDGRIYASYFIPKICNAQKVNMLPGVRKVPENADPQTATSGTFRIDPESADQQIIQFIDSVPTDSDMLDLLD